VEFCNCIHTAKDNTSGKLFQLQPHLLVEEDLVSTSFNQEGLCVVLGVKEAGLERRSTGV
jgi:hypothetical protein